MNMKKAVLWVSIGVLAFDLGMFVNYRIENKNKKKYIEKNLVNIINSQNEKLGIVHFGIPKLSYEQDSIPFIFSGIYRSKEDKIYLSTTFHLEGMLKTLNHELGHYYTDKLNESLGKGDFEIDFNDSKECFIGKKIIGEGIAEYFLCRMNGIEDDFQDSEWPADILGFYQSRVIYNGGHHFVKPIIDEHGKRGIEYLITNIPTLDDLKNFKKYQKKTLDCLSGDIVKTSSSPAP